MVKVLALSISLVLTLLVPAGSAAASDVDEITIDGAIVRGSIHAVGADGIVFEPEFGKGTVTIAYDKVERIASKRRFLVLYGESDQVVGRILGVQEGLLLVGSSLANAVTVEPQSIFSGNELDGALSTWDQLRSRWRYWEAALDAGLSYFDGTTDTTQASFGLGGERRKAGTRLQLQTTYRFGSERQPGEPTNRLVNEIRGLIKGEYDLSERLLVLTSFDSEYDEIERLSFRGVQRLGLGYRLYRTSAAFFQVESAPSYLYERYFGGGTNDFFGISFGAETGVQLPYAMRLTGRVDYLPSIKEWTEDYLVRAETALTMPLVSIVNLRYALVNQYNNTPAEGVDRNELQIILGLAIRL